MINEIEAKLADYSTTLAQIDLQLKGLRRDINELIRIEKVKAARLKQIANVDIATNTIIADVMNDG